MFDVLIIGCGVVGAATAYSLSKYNLSVAVCERSNDVANCVTKANSAIIHAGFDCKVGTLEARLNLEGKKLAKEICEKLDIEFREIPTFVLAFDERERGEIKMLYERGKANGVDDVYIIDKDEALKLEKELNPNIIEALYCKSSGIINPWEYAIAMSEVAVTNGAKMYLNSEVKAIEKTPEGHFVVKTTSGDYEAKYVVNAAGTFSADIYKMVGGEEFTHTNFCGQYHVLDKSQGTIINSVVFPCPDEHGFKGVLIAPTVHGNLVIGPDSYQVEDGDCVGTVAPMLNELIQHGKRSVPNLNFGETIHQFAGVRPNTTIPDFIIGESKACKNFINLAGIKSPGLTAAPAIALEGVKALEGCGLELIEKENYVDSRKRIIFKHLSNEEKNQLIKENPLYGQIVCRCEVVTEGEIVEAINRPIRPMTIDAIKRRCGAGLGRCQGGFCGPRVHEILARELGVSPIDILMDEEGTYMLTSEIKEV